MICVCCKQTIDKKQSHFYALGENFTKTRKKYYACKPCFDNNAFDQWMTAHPEKLNQPEDES